MNDRDQKRYDRDLRVQTFGEENAEDFAEGSKALELFEQLDGLIAEIETAKADQSPTRVSKETLIAELNADFTNISRTAKSIALDEPGFSTPYRVPDNAAESACLTHADALLNRLEDQTDDSADVKAAKAALRAKFVAYEMREDFVEDLRADTKAIRDANSENRGENLEGVGNTVLIGHLLDQTAMIAQKLNAIMHNKYATQPEKLRQWRSAYYVERDDHKKKETTTTPTQ